MAASIALNSSVNIDTTLDAGSKGLGRFAGSLLNRAKAVGEKLRNTTREDALFLGLSMGAGFLAKAGVVTALGVSTGGLGFAALGVALAGGAAMGLTKAGVKHFRDVKNGSDNKFFSRATLMSTASSAAIAAATFGLSEGFEYLTGDTIGHSLSKLFHKVADAAPAKLFALFPAGHALAADDMPRAMKTIPAAAPVPTPVTVAAPAPDDNMPRAMGKVPAPVSAPTPAAPIVAPAADAAQDNVPRAMGKPAVVTPDNDMPRAMGKVPAPAPVADIAPPATAPIEPAVQAAQPKADLPKTELAAKSSVGQHPTMDGGIRERALAWARAMNPIAKAVPDMPTAAPVATVSPPLAPVAEAPAAATPKSAVAEKLFTPSSASPQQLAAEAIAKAKLAVAQEELNNAYALERLQKMSAGMDVSADATAEDLAKRIMPNNAEGLLKGLQQQAPQIKVENLAASCDVEIPEKKSAVNTIKTLCYKFKEHMGGNDIALVNDTAEADPKKGLRLLYRKAVDAVVGSGASNSTNGFIAANISGPNGVVQEMAEAKLGL